MCASNDEPCDRAIYDMEIPWSDAVDPTPIPRHDETCPKAAFKYKGKKIRFFTPNRITLGRVHQILDKEPVTIDWLMSLEPGEVFVDVGANVGTYTLFAAVMRDVQVYAFEPEAQNFALLNRNITLNGLDGRVFAYPLALSDRCEVSVLHVSNLAAGTSTHSFNEAVDFNLEPKSFPFAQGSVSFPLDELIAQGTMPVPDHMKIDVDGFEHKVVAGGMDTLANPQLKSVLVELNPRIEAHLQVRRTLLDAGFTLDLKQVEMATRTEGQFQGLAENLFRRA